MRILAITNQYPRPGHETIAAFNRQQFRALAAEHELQVIAPIAWTDRLKAAMRFRMAPRHYRNLDGIKVHHPTYYFPPRVLEYRWGQCYYRSVHKLFRRVVASFRPDAVLACWAHPDGWAAVQLAREAGLPVLIKVIGSDILIAAQRLRRRRRIAEALREADGVVAVSQDLANRVVQFGVDPHRVYVVFEGLDETLFRPGSQAEARARLRLPQGEKIVLFVGNLLLSKGAGVLVEACARLRRERNDFSCCLVGQGRHEKTIRGLVTEHGLDGQVRLIGSRQQAQLPDWYRASDVVVLPSYSEGIPNVLREAMMCGRPFVATRVGGIPEIADPAYSRLVPPGDASAVAGAIGEILTARPVVDPAAARARNISWKQSAQLLADCLAGSCASRAFPLQSDRLHESAELTPKPLRVLAITNQYPRLGHASIAPFNYHQFQALACEHEVRVIAPVAWTEQLKDTLKIDRRPREYLNKHGIWVYHPTYYFPPKVLPYQWGQFYMRSIRATFERLLREFRPQVVLGCWAHPDGWAAVQLARQAGLPVLLKVHGSDVLVATRDPRRRRRVAEAVCQADGVIAVSQHLADHVVELGADPDKVHVVYNGVQDDLFSPGPQSGARARLGLPLNKKLLLFVGNILLSKGTGVLVEACQRLRQQGIDFHCYLIGHGRHAPSVASLIAAHQLADYVTLMGGRSQGELPDWYRASDVVVLPSYSEGIPNVLREAMMCGRPFVATRVGGIPEIADPAYSRLVPPGDANAVAGAIAEILATPLGQIDNIARSRSISWHQSAVQVAQRLRAVLPAAAGTLPEASLFPAHGEKRLQEA